MGIPEKTSVRTASVDARDVARACGELRARLGSPADAALTLVFCAPTVDRIALAAALGDAFPEPLLACTTAGEITPDGCRDGTLTAITLCRSRFAAATLPVADLRAQTLDSLRARFEALCADVEAGGGGAASFALSVVDGLAMQEERLLVGLGPRLATLPLVGGSAGDGGRYASTGVLVDRAFRSDAAMVAVVTTDLPVCAFKTEAFVAGEERMVVTSADPTQRVVSTLDGYPAAERYARVVETTAAALDQRHFAQRPLVLRIGGVPHVRAVRRVLPDGGLQLFCAVEEGLVLRAGQPIDLVADLERTMDRVRAQIGAPTVVIGNDCIQRREHIAAERLGTALDAVLQRHRVVGMRTYGEQFGRSHVNQSLTGLAIGGADR